MGGLKENAIRNVEQVMYNMIKDILLNEFQLHNVFTEIECIVNDRPMAYVSDDVNNLEPLTPITNFLLERYDMDKDLHVRVNNKNTRTWKKWT